MSGPVNASEALPGVPSRAGCCRSTLGVHTRDHAVLWSSPAVLTLRGIAHEYLGVCGNVSSATAGRVVSKDGTLGGSNRLVPDGRGV